MKPLELHALAAELAQEWESGADHDYIMTRVATHTVDRVVCARDPLEASYLALMIARYLSSNPGHDDSFLGALGNYATREQINYARLQANLS